MPLRNLPSEKPALLASLIQARPGQVSSMSLSDEEGVDMTLFAFAEGEDVSENSYIGDTLYCLVEGRAAVVFAEKTVEMGAGEVLMVPANTRHAIEAKGSFKVLQLTL